MTMQPNVGQLLRWRLALSEAEAPEAPTAASLLAIPRPWWELWPERFRDCVDRLSQIQVNHAFAMADPSRANPGGYLVPCVLENGAEQKEVHARILYFDVRKSQLRLRFALENPGEKAGDSLELTFVSEGAEHPLCAARAERSLDDEYHLEVELPGGIAAQWKHLKVTDRMPFRFILRPISGGE